MVKTQYINEEREKIIENLREYLSRAPIQFERAEQYLTAHPRASEKELERAGFSPLLEKAGYSSSILREYLGIKTPKQKRKIPIIKGTNNDSLLNTLYQKTLAKLVDYRNQNADRFTSITDYIATQHYQHNKSIRQLSREIGITHPVLRKIFKTYNLPMRSQSETNKEVLSERWKDEDFRKRNAEAVKENWKDEEFRKRQAEAVRKAKSNYTDTNSGYRQDLDRKTASNVEANIERAISRSGRNYETKFWYNDSNVKNHSATQPIYFLTTSPKGSKVAYVLIPFPNKKTQKKKEELESQGLRIRFATEKFYKTLERLMGKKIENWE